MSWGAMLGPITCKTLSFGSKSSRIQAAPGSALKHHLAGIVPNRRQASFAKNLLVLMSGTALAQLIGFCLSPVISRLFSPSDFGVYGSFDAISSIIAAGVTLEYTQAIMLPKEKENAISLFVVSCICTLAVTLLCLMFCLIAPAVVAGLIKTRSGLVLALLVVATAVNGLNQSCQAWCVRVKAFRQTSTSQVIRSASANGMNIGLAYLGAGASGLVVSSVVANVLAGLNFVRVLLPDLRALRHEIRWDRLKQLAKEYRDFPLYSASNNVMDALSRGLPVLLLTRFYGVAVAGAYAFGVRILQAPMGFVLGALRQVLFQKACETHNAGGRLMGLYVKFTFGLFCFAVLPAVVFSIWAPQIFSLVFGPQWRLSGEFARSLVLWLSFMFCNLPSELFAKILRLQRKMFFLDLAMLGTRAVVLIAGGMYLQASITLVLFSIVGALVNVVFIVLVGSALRRRQGSVDLRHGDNSQTEG
jgi:lipopolysaccharide exporter